MCKFVRQVKEQTKSFKIFQVIIELTERCNNDCIHCCINVPANDTDIQQRELKTDQIKEIIQQIADLGCLQVHFTGGEPLLRSDFEELYVFARRLGLKVLLYTNGRLITPHLANLFARIPTLVPIELTVYGIHKESYEAVTRTPGSFEQFWQGMDLLLERKVPFIVKAALLPPIYNEMDEIEAWAKTIPWMTDKVRYSFFFDLRFQRDNTDKNLFIESLRLSPNDGLAILLRDQIRYHQEIIAFASKFMGPAGDILFGCNVGGNICVDAYGHALPCIGLRMPELAVNLKEVELSIAFNLFCHLREIHTKNPDFLSLCARCFLYGLCKQCPAKAWTETGTIDTPVKYLCNVAHAQAQHFGWLNKDEHGWEVINWQERIYKNKKKGVEYE
jgi:radical SAM protein with 4Fe4S-binding SPASM domain